jgi:hypothetical protein
MTPRVDVPCARCPEAVVEGYVEEVVGELEALDPEGVADPVRDRGRRRHRSDSQTENLLGRADFAVALWERRVRVEYTRAPRRVVREVRRVLAAADNIHATSPPCGAGKYASDGAN